MLQSELNYLKHTINEFVNRYYTEDGVALFKSLNIEFCDFKSLVSPLPNTVCLPIDYENDQLKAGKLIVKQGNTNLIFWNLVSIPGESWSYDQQISPGWYKHLNGAVTPSWDLVGTLFKLLILDDENNIEKRDHHSRFCGQDSLRTVEDLLVRPIFNDAIAFLVHLAICDNNKKIYANGDRATRLTRPPSIFFSHDIDILSGNEFWTQISRFGRMFEDPISFYKIIKQIKYIAVNQMEPKKYYWDELMQMISLEEKYGFNSMIYFLNGKKGRYFSRTSDNEIKQISNVLQSRNALGIHYNYDTFLNSYKLTKQKKDLEKLVSSDIIFGRAHYLRFDSKRSWEDYISAGIKIDESLGFHDKVGFRSGVAAVYQPFDVNTKNAHKILAIPLAMMESTLLNQYGLRAINFIEELFMHIQQVGGAISILWHPGQYNNPEYPQYIGVYEELLKLARKYEFISGYNDFIN